MDNVNQPQLYPRPSPKDYAIPGDYFRAVQEWKHAQAVCGLRPLEPLPPDDKVRRFGDTELGRGIGSALVILALCLGIGGCLRLLI
jgi:hypothetical protein